MNVNPQPHVIIPSNLLPIIYNLLASKQQPPPLTNPDEEAAWKMAVDYRISIYRFPGPLANTVRALQGAQKHFFKKLFTFKETPVHALVEEEAVIYPLDEIDRERIVYYQGSLLDLLTDRSLKKHVHDETRIRWNQVGRQIKVISAKFRAAIKKMGGNAPPGGDDEMGANISTTDEVSEGESGSGSAVAGSSADPNADPSAMILPRTSIEPIPLITIMEPLAIYNYVNDYKPPPYEATPTSTPTKYESHHHATDTSAIDDDTINSPSSPKLATNTEHHPAAATTRQAKTMATRQQNQQGLKAVSSPSVPKHQPYGSGTSSSSPKISARHTPQTIQQQKPPLQPLNTITNQQQQHVNSLNNIQIPSDRSSEEAARLAARSRELRKQRVIEFVPAPPPPVQQNIIRLTDQQSSIARIQEMRNIYIRDNRIGDDFYNRGKIPFFKLSTASKSPITITNDTNKTPTVATTNNNNNNINNNK